MAGCDVLHLKPIVEGRSDLLDVKIARHYEVKAARDQMDARVDRAGRFDNLVNAVLREGASMTSRTQSGWCGG